ncbi:MAG: alpha-galactosidase [Victivallales bacterium]
MEKSKLYQEHPEWVLHEPGRRRSIGRQQMLLDMSRPDVVQYLFETISNILHSANIEYVKWDMNRNLTEVYSDMLSPERQGEVAHRFMLGVYRLHEMLLKEFPGLLIEGCSGGGGRFDAGMLGYVPQIWCSDDTDAMERILIQLGTSYFYPVSTIGAHVSVCPNHITGRSTPFATRGNIALSGTFGYELDLTKLTEEDQALVRKQVADYHRYHHIIAGGDPTVCRILSR